MKKIFFLLLLLPAVYGQTQPMTYSTANLHSHNDYLQAMPFQLAYQLGLGSIEADVFLQNGKLLVAHSDKELPGANTLEKLYLQPLQFIGAQLRPLQMVIDIKTDSVETLQALLQLLQQYPSLIHHSPVRWVVSGNRPAITTYNSYPEYILFDGEMHREYPSHVLPRIAMFSGSLYEETHWNGKGILPEEDFARIKKMVDSAHAIHKPVRFWGAPDLTNAWYQLMHLKVDYINTDHIQTAAAFFKQLPARSYTATHQHKVYEPSYTIDGSTLIPQNVILIIGDGSGLAQWYAGYTANKGQLNVFQMKKTGLSKTSSHDSYVTDSAPGSTAFASGQKTNNRFVGVDHARKPLKLLPAILSRKKMITGVVTSGSLTDATPADFYAHQADRDSADAVWKDLAVSSLQLALGAGNSALQANAALLKQNGFCLLTSLDSLPTSGIKRYVVADTIAGRSMQKGRGTWLPTAFDKAVNLLQQNKNGFFLMLEGAQIDYGGHANQLSYVVEEVMDLDAVVGKALQYADNHKNTLVIVTADHETGGLSLLDGDFTRGYVSGQFSSEDHSAIPVPVFAYGPQSGLFTGVYENTEVFFKILKALGL